MPEADDHQLLAEFASAGSEPAFAALVARYVNLVYSTAFRSTGNAQNAEEITQTVFIILARKAETLSPGVVLSGWLYQTTRLTAANFMKSEFRRRRHQEEAAMQSLLNEPAETSWREIAPLLDEAMGRLGQTDRDALLLRYFENKSAAEIGAALRMNEDTARRRMNRALEKLRRFFLKCGVASTTATIGESISANSVQAAPVALAKSVTAAAITKGAAASGSTLTVMKGVLKIMAWTKAKSGIAGAVVAAGILAPLIIQHQAQAKLRENDALLQKQSQQLASIQADRDRLSKQAANCTLSQEQLNDLQKLRAEIGPLRAQAKEVVQLQEENRQLKSRTDKPKTPLQMKEEAMAKMSFSKSWIIAFYHFAEKNQGQFPGDFAQAAAFAPDKLKNQADVTTDQFDIVFQGSPSSLTNPADVIVLREKEAHNAGETSHPPGQWAKIYSFADGHSEIHMELNNDFTAYEAAHIIPANNQ